MKLQRPAEHLALLQDEWFQAYWDVRRWLAHAAKQGNAGIGLGNTSQGSFSLYSGPWQNVRVPVLYLLA